MATSLIDFNALRPNAAMEAYQQGQQNQLAQMQLSQQQQAIRDAEAEREAGKAAGSDYAKLQQELFNRGLTKQGMAAGAAQTKQQSEKLAMMKSSTELLESTAKSIYNNPENAVERVIQFGKQTGHDVSQDLAELQSYGGNPDKIKLWAAGHAFKAADLLPQFETRNLGSTTERQGYSRQTGAAVGPATVYKNTMSPDAMAADARARENIQIAKDREARLAQGPMGTTLTPEQNDALFGENGAVSLGKLNPNKINSRNAKMWADAFLKNPSADPVKIAQDVATADKAVKDFGTGPQGVKVVAFNTAIDHLETLDELGLALKGGDVQRFNALANRLGVEAGQPAATMYNQAAKIVGGEISKAIVPGVGTGKEREEAAAAFNSAMSPDQLVGASTTAKKLLGGQLSSLEAQYARTTKRKDFADQFLSPAARAAYQRSRPATESTAPSKGNLSPDEQAELEKLRARFNK